VEPPTLVEAYSPGAMLFMENHAPLSGLVMGIGVSSGELLGQL